MITLEPGMICEWKGCNEAATAIASGRKNWRSQKADMLGTYCDIHAEIVSTEGEYRTVCPNCSCIFGVN